MKKGLIFDLDGTLWDARATLVKSYNETMAKHHLKYRFDLDKVTSYMGLTPLDTIKIAFTDVSEEEGLKYFSYLVEDEIVFLKTNPGITYQNEDEVLSKLQNDYDLFIVSNCETGYIETYLEGCHKEKYFKDYLCIGMTKKEKFENIRIIMEKHKIKDAIYIGDTLKDYNETSKANIPFIHARYGFGIVDNAKYYINNLLELPKVVTKVFSENNN